MSDLETTVRRITRLLDSTRGAHFQQLVEATGGQIILTIGHPDWLSGKRPGTVQDPETTTVQFTPLAGISIDTKADIPQQLAALLTQWSAELASLATAVRSIPSVPFKWDPKAYVVNDFETGEVIAAKLTPVEAARVMQGFLDMTGNLSEMTAESLLNHPELIHECTELAESANAGIEEDTELKRNPPFTECDD